jgi:hypothetical protein
VGCGVGCRFLAGGSGDRGVGDLGLRRISRMSKQSFRLRMPIVAWGLSQVAVKTTIASMICQICSRSGLGLLGFCDFGVVMIA